MSSQTKDALGARMKSQYEQRARTMLPRRTYTLVRLDGKAFHSYTRNLDRPFDLGFMHDMALTARYLVEGMQGAVFAYTQSDEISVLLTDFGGPSTEAWFDGNQQKIVSISAAMATAEFNRLRPGKIALFDSRAFTIPDPTEVENYFIWRQVDAVRNSISMAAQAKFSHNELHLKSSNEMQEMLWQEHRINWSHYSDEIKRGTVVYPRKVLEPVTYTDKRTGHVCTIDAVERRVWTVTGAPEFTKDRDWLTSRIWRQS